MGKTINCIFLGYMCEIADAIFNSSKAKLVAVGVEPQRLRSPLMEEFCKRNRIPFFDARNIRQNQEFLQHWLTDVDLVVVGAFGQILDSAILKRPKLGVINFHPSLLPAYRGGSPLEEQILRGDCVGGVTAHWMSEKVDTGAMILQREMQILETDDYDSLYGKVLKIAGSLMTEILNSSLTVKSTETHISSEFYEEEPKAPLRKEDALLNWNMSAGDLLKRIRAFGWRKWPVFIGKEIEITVTSARKFEGYQSPKTLPGTILEVNPLLVIQVAEGEALEILAFSSSQQLKKGEVLV